MYLDYFRRILLSRSPLVIAVFLMVFLDVFDEFGFFWLYTFHYPADSWSED